MPELTCANCGCSGIPGQEYSASDACPKCGNEISGETAIRDRQSTEILDDLEQLRSKGWRFQIRELGTGVRVEAYCSAKLGLWGYASTLRGALIGLIELAKTDGEIE